LTDRTPTWLEKPSDQAGCTVIAEVAQAHDGSLGQAHAYIDAAAAAGAHAVKFQTHIAAAESTALEPWRARFSKQDETRFDYWKRMEFTPEQWAGLKAHADEAGIMFLSSPFSLDAVELLKSVGVAGWKVASGEITNYPMLKAMAASGEPVMLSTGMSPLAEIDGAVEVLKGQGSRQSSALAVFQCTTQYPSPPESIGLNMIDELRARYGCAIGLSDHSGTIYPGLAAATLGVQVIEVHLTLSREMFGPDVVASLTPDELKCLVDGVRFIETAKANPADKSAVAPGAQAMRDIFLKSVMLRENLTAGTVLTADQLTTKKPGTGISARFYDDVTGRTLACDVDVDVPLKWDDLEGGEPE